MGKRKEKKAFLEKRNLWEAEGGKKQNPPLSTRDARDEQ